MEQKGKSRTINVFIKCHIDALILGNWGVKGRRRGENWKIPAVSPSLPRSSPSLHRVTVSDGRRLTGRRRSKKTVVLSSASEMTCDTSIHTHRPSSTEGDSDETVSTH